jgi:hypothetical protein
MTQHSPARLIPRTLFLLTACGTASCGPRTADENQVAREPEEPAVNLSVMVPDPAVNRAALLMAVAKAGSAAAAGTNDAEEQRALEGRQFEIRIRFGCDGAAEDLKKEWLGWRVDQQSKTLRVRAAPTVAADDPLVQRIVGNSEFEAIEGFWIPRPWLLQASCPAGRRPQEGPTGASAGPADAQVKTAPAIAATAAPTEKTLQSAGQAPTWPRVGLAQFYIRSDSRTGRRQQRAYEAVKTLEDDKPVGTEGFNLVLAGRLKAIAGRSLIQCATAGPDSPPECIVSVDFDRVWIERADSKAVVADWSHG